MHSDGKERKALGHAEGSPQRPPLPAFSSKSWPHSLTFHPQAPTSLTPINSLPFVPPPTEPTGIRDGRKGGMSAESRHTRRRRASRGKWSLRSHWKMNNSSGMVSDFIGICALTCAEIPIWDRLFLEEEFVLVTLSHGPLHFTKQFRVN